MRLYFEDRGGIVSTVPGEKGPITFGRKRKQQMQIKSPKELLQEMGMNLRKYREARGRGVSLALPTLEGGW